MGSMKITAESGATPSDQRSPSTSSTRTKISKKDQHPGLMWSDFIRRRKKD